MRQLTISYPVPAFVPLALAAIACSTPDMAGVDMRNPGLVRLEILPGDATTRIEASQPAELDFKAMGTFSGQPQASDISSKVLWNVSDDGLGVFGVDAKASRFRSSSTRGGRAIITAISKPVMPAMAMITVVYSAALVHGGAPGTAPDLFKSAAEEASKSPTLIGPADGASVDRSQPPQKFEWAAAAGTDLFELSFSNDVTDLRLYTPGTSLTPSAEEWSILTGTNAGGAVKVKLRGMKATAPSTAGSAPAITVSFK